MSALVDLLVRLIAILIAYLCAALAASAFLHLVAWPAVGMAGEAAPWALLGGFFFSVPFVALFTAYFAFAPSAVLIGLSEALRVRSWIFHALAGAGAGVASLSLFWQFDPRGAEELSLSAATGQVPLAHTPEAMAAVVGAGICGGFIYWLICGRRAGEWLDRRRDLSRRPPISPAR